MYKLLQATLLSLLALIGSAVPALADSAEDFSFRLEAGYRLDELDWNIDGGAVGPNIRSELKWKDLAIYQVRGSGKLHVGEDASPIALCLKGSLAYGWIIDGENQDSDFDGNDRTLEFSRSNNKSDDGNVLDVSAGIGPRLRLDENLMITPLFGISYHGQNLTMTDGFQTIPLTGPFEGLDSTYEARWFGPWAGVDMEWMPVERFRLEGSFEYHWADFDAEADWNLRAEFAHPKSFEHESDGEGIILAFAGAYDLADRWSVHLLLDYRELKAEDGKIRFFLRGRRPSDPGTQRSELAVLGCHARCNLSFPLKGCRSFFGCRIQELVIEVSLLSGCSAAW